MNPNDLPEDEVTAAKDALFEEPDALPAVPPGKPSSKPPAAPLDASSPPPDVPPRTPRPGGPIGDYVREIQLEFEQQMDEGKL